MKVYEKVPGTCQLCAVGDTPDRVPHDCTLSAGAFAHYRPLEIVRTVTIEELGNGAAWNIEWGQDGPPSGTFYLVEIPQ